MTPSLKVLIAHDHADSYLDRLRRGFPSIHFDVAACAADLQALAAKSPAIVYSCTTHTFPRIEHRPVLDIPSLRWLHVGGSGFEHFAGWNPDRITLTNGVGVLAPFMADTVMGAVIALNNGFFDYRDNQRKRAWRPRRFRALAGQTLLVIGPGAVGSALARIARAHGMRTVGAARQPRPLEHFDEVAGIAELPDLVGSAEWVSLHLRLTNETRNLVDRAFLSRMRSDAHLINSARGGVVQEDALIEALRERKIAGAYLDVTAIEPLPEDSPIWHMDNLFLTPHCSDQVIDWQERHADLFMDNLDRWLREQPLLNQVTPEPG